MIYLFLACDEYLRAGRLATLKSAVGDAEMADLNTAEMIGGRVSSPELLGQVSMMPFLAVRRLVIVEGHLAHLDKRMSASKGTNSAAHQEAAQLLEGLTQIPETNDLVFIEENIDKRRHLWRGYTISGTDGEADRRVPGIDGLVKQEVIELETTGTPNPRALPGWIHQHAKRKQIAIEGRAVQMLAAYVGPNLRLLDTELEKLATYARDRAINDADVNLLVSDASEAMIWDLTDALSQRNPRLAMQTLALLRQSDANAFYLLTMIARQYRIMLKVKEAMEITHGRPSNENDIAKQVGERPYPVKKAMQQARGYTIDELVNILDRLLTADFAMKTGTDADTEIDILVAELTTRVQAH